MATHLQSLRILSDAALISDLHANSPLAVVDAVANSRRSRGTFPKPRKRPCRDATVNGGIPVSAGCTLQAIGGGLSIAVNAQGQCKKCDVRAVLMQLGRMMGKPLSAADLEGMWQTLGGNIEKQTCAVDILRDQLSGVFEDSDGDLPDEQLTAASRVASIKHDMQLLADVEEKHLQIEYEQYQMRGMPS